MFGKLLGICLVAAALAGAPAHAVKKGGTLTVGIETDVRGFDPGTGGVLGISGRFVSQLIHRSLLRFNRETKEFEPKAAIAWEYNDDRTELTVKLRPGVKFHNGKPFNAEQVAFHYNRILDPATKSRSRSFISTIKEVQVVDDLTVKFILKHPWVPLTAALSGIDQVGAIAEMSQVQADKQQREPVGTGPFRFVEWKGGDRIVLERNPDYWDAESVHLDRIIFRILPDTQTRYAALKAGEVDLIWTDRGNTIARASTDPDLQHHWANAAGAGLQLLNTSNPPLDDPRVRAAILHALDQRVTLKVTFKDTRPLGYHPFGDEIDCGKAGYREYDPDKAKALLAEYGKPVKISLIHTTTPRGREIGEVSQQLLKRVGIELELVPVDQNTLVKRVFSNEYEMSGWRIADAVDIGPQLYGLNHSKSSYNITRYKNEELDKLVTAMRVEPDRKTREGLLCQVAEKINDSGHLRFVLGNRYHLFAGKSVRGMGQVFQGTIDLGSIWLDE